MEYYKQINKELSLNNQELRNVVQRLKLEITHVNRQLLEQREETVRLKEAIAQTIEQKYHETMAIIYPEKKISKINSETRRRSFVSATVADPIMNRSHSPTISLPDDEEFKDEPITITRTPIPSIIVEEIGSFQKIPSQTNFNYSETMKSNDNLNYSESRKSDDDQTSKSVTEDNSETCMLEQTSMASNSGLVTITEKSPCPNETLSDSTINLLLDAPCSTPFNPQKDSNSCFKPKEFRIFVKKLSVEDLARLSTEKTLTTQNNYSSFQNTKSNIEECHAQNNFTLLHTTNNLTYKNKIKTSSSGEFFAGTKIIANNIKTEKREVTLKDRSMKRLKQKEKPKQNKENQETDSERTYYFSSSDEETNVLRRRLRHKPVSLKEPSLRTKLRNTTNIKF